MLNPAIDVDELLEAVRESMFGMEMPGFCNACGAYVDGVEPDARHYECYECGEHEVYGAEELLLMYCP